MQHVQRKSRNIVFEPPIKTSDGGYITLYSWKYKTEDVYNEYEGEYQGKKVSDWDNALISSDTGREIVHVFGKCDCNYKNEKLVSLESALGLLADRKTDGTKLKSIVNTMKTIHKHKMSLQFHEHTKEEYVLLYNHIEPQLLSKYPIGYKVVKGDIIDIDINLIDNDIIINHKSSLFMFDGFKIIDSNTIEYETNSIITDIFRTKYPEYFKFCNVSLNNFNYDIRSLEDKIRKLEAKIKYE